MLGKLKVSDIDYKPELEGFAIKQPVFSFNKFPNVNKSLGPEMKSTGESILFIDDLKDNITGANQVGLHGVHYKNTLELKEELKTLNIIND